MAACVEDPSHPCCYIEGPGEGDDILGKAFGLGMKKRVLVAYEFLSKHWRKKGDNGDKIVIYGFSRGAFEARILAGLMAHCGLPDGVAKGRSNKLTKEENARLEKTIDEVWEYCRNSLKDPQDEPGKQTWAVQLSKNQQAVEQKFSSSGFRFNHPKISCLALWDTVPGLSFTDLDLDTYGTSNPKHPQVYKVRPYPNVELILHALALDEHRSRFQPLLVGPPIDPTKTTVYEVWFPGAHADIGGGDADSNDMAGISFNWINQMMLDRKIIPRYTRAYSDCSGVLHHPENLVFNSFGSHKMRRIVPPNSVIDETVFKRAMDKHPFEEGHTEFVTYAPTIPVGVTGHVLEEIKITAASTKSERQAILDGKKGAKLVLNPSQTDKSSQVPSTGKPLPINAMHVQTAPVAKP